MQIRQKQKNNKPGSEESRVQGVKKRAKVRGTIALKQVQGWDEGRMNTTLPFCPSESREYRGKNGRPSAADF